MTTKVVRKDKEKKEVEKEMLQKVLMTLLRDEENRYCADCESKGPRWASWNLGVFVCIRCAGIHRKLGVHISKVKSINLDGWTDEQVASMCGMGNSVAKVVYEDSLPQQFRRPQSDTSLEQFIRAKYEHKRYMIKDWQKPPVDVTQLPCYDDIVELRSTGIVRTGVRPSNKPRVQVPVAPSSQPPPPQPQPQPSNDLVDFDFVAAPAAQPTSGLNELFDLDVAQPTTNGNNNQLDDVFNDFVSATPTNIPNSNQLFDTTGIVDSGSTQTACTDSKKSNADIMALFAATAPQQAYGGMPPFAGINQQLSGLNLGEVSQGDMCPPHQVSSAAYGPPKQQQFNMAKGAPQRSAQQMQQSALNSLFSSGGPTNNSTKHVSTDLWQ